VAHVIDDEAAHDTRRVSHEAALVGKRRRFPARQLEIGLVEEAGRTQHAVVRSPAELASGDAVQLRVQRGEKRLRGTVASVGRRDQRRNRSSQRQHYLSLIVFLSFFCPRSRSFQQSARNEVAVIQPDSTRMSASNEVDVQRHASTRREWSGEIMALETMK